MILLSIPLTYLWLDSETKFNLFEVFLILTPSKIAASTTKSVVFSSTIVDKLPITPPKHTGFTPSVITISSAVNVLSTSSNVVNFSPSLAILTTILLPNLSASNAWSGWPYSIKI